jgi:hypothetical protein
MVIVRASLYVVLPVCCLSRPGGALAKSYGHTPFNFEVSNIPHNPVPGIIAAIRSLTI